MDRSIDRDFDIRAKYIKTVRPDNTMYPTCFRTRISCESVSERGAELCHVTSFGELVVIIWRITYCR